MRANESDGDWLRGDDVDGTAITERPGAPTDCWRCDGDDYEPARYATLLEATSDRPLSPEAWVSSHGELMAVSADDVAQWTLSVAGRDRLEREMHAALHNDIDVVLNVLLGVELAEAAE